MAVIRAYRTSSWDERYSLFQFNLDIPMTKELLKKSGFTRLEVWVPEQLDLSSKGWVRATRSDGSPIVSDFGNALWVFPARPEIPMFPGLDADVPF